MVFWSAQHLATLTQGRWLVAPLDPTAPLPAPQGFDNSHPHPRINIDSRTFLPHQIFLAIPGEHFDGHDFLQHAIDHQASLLILSNPDKITALHQPSPNIPILCVPDTIVALQTLAHHYRDHLRSLDIKVIAVGGSNGKTSTRHLIHSALSQAFPGTQSPKSFNNHLGVPLTLLSVADHPYPHPTLHTHWPDRFVVVEIGTNHPGEIDALARIVRPDAAVITSIGHEHMEFFRTLQGVAQEESALLPHVAPQGLIAIESNAWTLLQPFAQLPPHTRLLRFGSELPLSPDTLTFACPPQAHQFEQTYTLPTGTTIRLPLLGQHNAVNSLAAVAIGRWMGMSDDLIATALAHVGVSMRLEIRRLGAPSPQPGAWLINDAYNANPDSVMAGLQALASLQLHQNARKIAVLGDMFELGDLAPDLHRMVGQHLAQLQATIHLAILIGRLSMFTAEALLRHWPASRVILHPAWFDDLPLKISQLTQPEDVIFLKASRGMKLERLLPALEQRFAAV